MPKLKLEKDKNASFDYISSYVLSFVSLTLTFEVYGSSSPGIYLENHTISLTSKQQEKGIIFYPYDILNKFFINGTWPDSLYYEIKDEKFETQPPPRLPLGHLEKPLFGFSQSVISNFYENNKNIIESKYNNDPSLWPNEWNFARIIRNSVSHGNKIYIANTKAPNVKWYNLSYGPLDNGKPVIHYDIWPGDLILLILEMEKSL